MADAVNIGPTPVQNAVARRAFGVMKPPPTQGELW